MGISDKISDKALVMLIGNIRERSIQEYDRLGIKKNLDKKIK